MHETKSSFVSESSLSGHPPLEVVDAEIVEEVDQQEPFVGDTLRLLRRFKQEKAELETALAQAQAESQKQLRRLLDELDIAQHTITRQQQHIHHLTQELELYQGQVGELERECALLQEEYSEQQHKLLRAERQAAAHKKGKPTSKVVELPSFLKSAPNPPL